MAKNSVDTNWTQEQLDFANTGEDVADAVTALLEAWEGVDLAPGQRAEALEKFRELAQGHSLLKDETDEVWVDVLHGFVHTGDIVRVRHDAFEDELGTLHNGRVGKVVGVRGGLIYFRSTDEKTPFIDGARYSAEKLERRVS